MHKKVSRLVAIALTAVWMTAGYAMATELKDAEKITYSGNGFYAVPFQAHGVVSKVRLGAAYLLRPEAAKQADVLWTFPLVYPMIVDAVANGDLRGPLYLASSDGSTFTVLSQMATKAMVKKHGSYKKINAFAEAKGLEAGIAFESAVYNGMKAKMSMISWYGKETVRVFPDQESLDAFLEMLGSR